MMLAIAREAGVNVAWLATGEGPRERGQAVETKKRWAMNRDGTPASTSPSRREEAEDEDEDEGVERVNVAVFFSIVEAVQELEGDLSHEDRIEIGLRMMRAIGIAADADENEERLVKEDFHALARIVRKLVSVSQT